MSGVDIGALIAFEQGELDEDETIAFFQGLIDSGVVWGLQGSYGRMARYLLDEGFCQEADTKIEEVM
jgi:hypothetical protein